MSESRRGSSRSTVKASRSRRAASPPDARSRQYASVSGRRYADSSSSSTDDASFPASAARACSRRRSPPARSAIAARQDSRGL
ncbi:hypothetical protein FHS41_003668 [Streptomyces violarus]|uniref:Uncharacterized protein n=1 Tax=Streptomyces violarus TaxID=67380 RepID=A0A7W4ZR62_9ACTN|nr:hypothetical protein [Streptomyces violarus]